MDDEEKGIQIKFVQVEGLQPHTVKRRSELRECALKSSTNRRGCPYTWVVHPINLWEFFLDCEKGLYLGFPVRASVNVKKNRLLLVRNETADNLFPLEE